MSFSSSSTVPIEFLPHIGRRTSKVLRSLGISTIGQFKQLPEQLLIELFGPSIRLACMVAHGSSYIATQTAVVEEQAKNHSWLKKLQLATQLVTLL